MYARDAVWLSEEIAAGYETLEEKDRNFEVLVFAEVEHSPHR